MKKGFLFALTILLLVSLASCSQEGAMTSIVSVRYTLDAGTLPPELRWHEEYMISDEGVVFSRSAFQEETQVNTGSWMVEIEAGAVDALLDQLNEADLKGIERVEPADAPDGGGSESILLLDASGRSFSLDFINGVTYTGAEGVVEPVREFIHNLVLPEEAVVQYNLDGN